MMTPFAARAARRFCATWGIDQRTGVDSTGGLGRISAAKRRFVNDDNVGARLVGKCETRDDEKNGAAIAATLSGPTVHMSEKEEKENEKEESEEQENEKEESEEQENEK